MGFKLGVAGGVCRLGQDLRRMARLGSAIMANRSMAGERITEINLVKAIVLPWP